MQSTRKIFHEFVWDNLGRCPKCIRKAGLAAMCTSIFALLLAAMQSPLWPPVAVVAALLTALWLAHLYAFATKVTVLPNKEFSDVAADAVFRDKDSPSRRTAIPLFVRGLVFGAVISVMPRPALADGIGGCGADGCPSCERPFYNNGVRYACVDCHSCGCAYDAENC
jgi:hypothetical protein